MAFVKYQIVCLLVLVLVLNLMEVSMVKVNNGPMRRCKSRPMCVVKSEDGSTEQIATCSADNKRNSCPPECECPSSPWLPGIHLKLEAFYCCKKKKSGYGSYNKYGNKYNGGQ